MEIFYRLLFGHLLADFTFQTNYIAYWKRQRFFWLCVHVIIHPLCYIPLVWPFINDVWVTRLGVELNGWACLGIITLLHFGEDWFRATMVNRGWRDNSLFYAWDQIIHIGVLLLFTPLKAYPLVSQWPLLGILFVSVTHFATVTVWFAERDIYGYDREYPATGEKYISMAQRLAVWVFFFLPLPLWFMGPVVVAGLYAWLVWNKKVDFSWPSIIGGNLMTICAGLFGRFGMGFRF